MLGDEQRVLISIIFATFSPLRIEQPETLDLLLNLVEKLGTLLFQTLPAPTLAQFLPGFVTIEHPSIHLNVLSLLFQSRDDNDPQSFIDEALGYLKDSDDPYIHSHYLQRAVDNPLLTVILQLALENRGQPLQSYNGLPDQLRRYLKLRCTTVWIGLGFTFSNAARLGSGYGLDWVINWVLFLIVVKTIYLLL